jgi:hypothetical protein
MVHIPYGREFDGKECGREVLGMGWDSESQIAE